MIVRHSLGVVLLVTAGSLVGACVRPYVPPARPLGVHGDAPHPWQLDGSVGLDGGRLGATRAVGDAWVGRGATAWSLAPGDAMGSVELGVGRVGRTAELPRWLEGATGAYGLFVDGGLGRGLSRATWQKSGSLGLEAALAWPHASLGGALRASFVGLDQPAGLFDAARSGRALLLQPMLELRLGLVRWKLVVQAGLSYPLWQRGDLGANWPLAAGLGLAYDGFGGDDA